jgi:hypothetical protein
VSGPVWAGSVVAVDEDACLVVVPNGGGTVTVVYTGGDVTKRVLVFFGGDLVEVGFGDVVGGGRVMAEARSTPSGDEVLVGRRVVAGAWSMPSESAGVVGVRVMAEARSMPSPAEGRGSSDEKAAEEAASMSSGLLLWDETVKADAWSTLSPADLRRWGEEKTLEGSSLSSWDSEKSAESVELACGVAVVWSAPETSRRIERVTRMRDNIVEED